MTEPMTPEVAAEYARLVAAGAPAGPRTVEQAQRNTAPSAQMAPQDIATLTKAGLMTRGEGRRAAGLPEDAPRDATAVVRAAMGLAVYARHVRIAPPDAAQWARDLYQAIRATYPEVLARFEQAIGTDSDITHTQSEETK
jgi:hypothetical protein